MLVKDLPRTSCPWGTVIEIAGLGSWTVDHHSVINLLAGIAIAYYVLAKKAEMVLASEIMGMIETIEVFDFGRLVKVRLAGVSIPEKGLIRLEDLSPEERERNQLAASEMVPNQHYTFTKPAKAIPLEHMTNPMSRSYMLPITFRRATYVRYDEEKEEHKE